MNTTINTDWSTLKTFIQTNKLNIQYLESVDFYYLVVFDNQFSLSCTIEKTGDSNQIDFENNYKSNSNKSPKSEVVTQFEKDDKVLKLFKTKAIVNESGIATIEAKVPGNPETDGRYVDSGMVWFDGHHADDQIQSVEVVDVDNLYGYGMGFVLRVWHDDDASSENQGWYLPSTNMPLQVTSLGGYGFIPSGTYLRIVAKKGQSQTSGVLYLNLKWGKEE